MMNLLRRRPDAEHPAAADGERLRPGLIAQPVNTVSSVAYLASAVALAPLLPARTADPVGAVAGRLLCVSLAANGLGSMGFHGPGDPLSHRTHDWSLWSMIGVIGVGITRGLIGSRPPGHRAGLLRGLAGPGAALAVGAVLNTLGRTGGRWCRPDSLWQWHAAWHVISAAAVGHAGRVLFGQCCETVGGLPAW